jgi:hypothetical protein
MFFRFIIIYILAIPLCIHAAVVVLIYIDKGSKTKIAEVRCFIIFAAILCLLMIVSAFAFLSVAGGIGFLFASFYVVFLAGYLFQRLTKEKKDIAPWWFTVNRIMTVLLVASGFLAQLFSGNGSGFVGITFTMAFLLIFLWGFGIFNLAKDLADRVSRPVYISPNILPFFKYDSDA